MGRYADNPAAIKALFRGNEVHRDVYIDPEIYKIEMKHLFANAWVFVGHESQTPNKGDYFSTQVGDQPVIQVRHSDGEVHVLHNRCPHKGTKIVIDRAGNTGKFFRCPYHAWSFKTDGCLLAIPLKKGYEKALAMGKGGLSKLEDWANSEQSQKIRADVDEFFTNLGEVSSEKAEVAKEKLDAAVKKGGELIRELKKQKAGEVAGELRKSLEGIIEETEGLRSDVRQRLKNMLDEIPTGQGEESEPPPAAGS